MLSIHKFQQKFIHEFKVSLKKLHSSSILLSSQDSSSSSSDSSDSDLESKKNVGVETKPKFNKSIDDKPKVSRTLNQEQNEKLNNLLLKLAQKSTNKDVEDFKVSIKAPAIRFEALRKSRPKHEKPFEEKFVTAAKDLADKMGGDKELTEYELLSKVLKPKLESSDDATGTSPNQLKDEVTGMEVDTSTKKSLFSKQKSRKQRERLTKVSEFSEAPKETDKQPTQSDEESRYEQLSKALRKGDPQEIKTQPKELSDLLSEMKIDIAPSRRRTYLEKKIEMARKIRAENSMTMSILRQKEEGLADQQCILSRAESDIKIFSPDLIPNENLPKLSIWEELYQKQLKVAVVLPPENAFQELIQWTEEGRLWQFPINNEQGLEEEAKVHFSEHVFLEKHIRGWCPKKGPIRHFMELVCLGLSRNPYITVEQKKGHIHWYRGYFAIKRDLLKEIEAINQEEYEKLEPYIQPHDEFFPPHKYNIINYPVF